jgi:hypothetical protein
MANHTKVHFRLDQDEDGYPPVAVESVWATPTEVEGRFVLDNVPFFARDATLGDEVITSTGEGGCWFERVVLRSGNSLVRVVFFDVIHQGRVAEELEAFGCSTEGLEAHSLLAVSIPAQISLKTVQTYLRGEAAADHLDYEEPLLRQ